VPTVGELRVRKEVEQANRKIVGFWGTVLGVRRVGKVGMLQDGDSGCADMEEERSGIVLKNTGADLSRRSGSADPVVDATAEDGGSLASSHHERDLEAEHPVEAEAKTESGLSVASANNEPVHAKPDSVNRSGEAHDKSRSGSMMGAAAGVPKAEAESAKSVAGSTGRAEEESMRSRQGTAEAAGETRAESLDNQ
jgi:hypothetical protein